MPTKRELQEVEQAAEAIDDLLAYAVQATIDDRSHEPGRQAAAEFFAIDDDAAPDSDGGPAELLATLTLARWLSLAREELADRPERVEEVLAWIEENLGKRYRARARYTAGVLESEAAAGEITAYAPALREEFMPTLVWLLAGVVARYGEGGIGWLRALDTGASSAGSRWQ